MTVTNELFINYRGSDEEFAALYVERCLADHFGREAVFRDSESIPPGVHFPDLIWKALQQCQVLIAIIGEAWLRRGPDEQRLIDRPEDYVRRELAEALRRDIRVVPVLVRNACLPDARLLPVDIAGLATRQYVHLRVRTAENDTSRLVEKLAEVLGWPESTVPCQAGGDPVRGCRPRVSRSIAYRRGRRSSA
jgi:hypothetical protein